MARARGAVTVSVVIPARDAAATLLETLDSLRDQAFTAWEAVVVDDGSSDGTRAIAERRAAEDARVRVIAGEGGGVSRARNLGLAAARFETVLFLDADDWLDPPALAQLAGALAGDSELAGAYCGWRRVSPAGEIIVGHDAESPDLFDELARRCPFAIHSCLVRTRLVRQAGGFDPSLRCSEDWDLWQRLARSGARFGRVPGVLVGYRMRSDSASLNTGELLRTGLEVIDRGHAPDPRVPYPDPRHAAGRDRALLPSARWLMLAWSAAVEIGGGGTGETAVAAAAAGEGARVPVDVDTVAGGLHTGVAVGASAAAGRWPELWDGVIGRVVEVLERFEALSGCPALARRVLRRLEGMVAEGLAPGASRPAVFGSTWAVEVDWREPLEDLRPPAGTGRLVIALAPAGGLVHLPVAGAVVPAWLLADAVAAQAGWAIFEWFRQARGEEATWDGLLADLLGAPGITSGQAYDAAWSGPAGPAGLDTGPPVITVGGAALGRLDDGPAPDPGGRRVAALTEAGTELVSAVVRESILGRPTDGPPLAEHPCRPQPLAPPEGGARLGRRRPWRLDSSQARRALLPGAEASRLLAMARACGEPATQAGPGLVVYDPQDVGPEAAPEPAARAESLVGPAIDQRLHFERWFAGGEDPWRYDGAYERAKRELVLSLLPPGPVERTLEIGCAEGRMTVELAPRARQLVATEIASLALERARARLAGAAGVELRRLDVRTDALPREMDLVVAAEVLYYVDDRAQLDAVARRLRRCLRPGGVLVHAHSWLLADDPERPGFDWPHAVGARAIADVLAGQQLELEEEIRTPWYLVQRLRARPRPRPRLPRRAAPAPVVREEPATPPPPDVLSRFHPRGRPAAPPADDRVEPGLDRLPILCYHAIAADGPQATATWRLDPAAFDAQLGFLRDLGFVSAGIDAWSTGVRRRARPAQRSVVLTFDDGFADFGDVAWPILRRHGFGATVFLPTGRVGGASEWDALYDAAQPLMGWPEVRRLERDGVRFGAHTATHRPLTGLTPAEVVTELAESRTALAQELVDPVPAIAYPYGDADATVGHLAAAVGFEHGLTCRAASASHGDDPMALPRLVIEGSDQLSDLVVRLTS